ncbi:hypothetical protein N7474_011085 [Penicillium riverlandense]|uniref:uncharacterized protein n=1 Tax=Penicillium riverlandense TaxID=1903569 RepID=UPI0025495223|nr:uncharacterized protein N7474_011085 [Penicillium riverlandense]KAJ5805198.1 hypothetical protein N7474_011085 [Penicillium riverlandense]
MAASRARPKPLNWSPPSHLTVFVRNLRLLQLDQQPDWPGISLRTLSPSSQNHRQRIRLVEWALFHLFAIWDLEETQNKLRPFFPPLEPLQSVNLRAALFRVLSELKKNGELGREVTLRKTMLDDCKGEKFDELLAVFSTVVLRKVMAGSVEETFQTPALNLATATNISPADYQNLVPLILAHQVSLGSVGEHRARVREVYEQFSRLLDAKKVELAQRAETLPVHGAEHANSEGLERELRANWLGSEEWASALLEGGAQSSTDAFLELPFSEAWARATGSTAEGLSGNLKQDLVMDLEARVLRQRNRLRKWHAYNDSIRQEQNASARTTDAVPKEPQLLFRDHQSLTVASLSKTGRQPTDRRRVLTDSDQSLISSVNEAISHISGKSHRVPTPPLAEAMNYVEEPLQDLTEPTRPAVSSPVAEDDPASSPPEMANSPDHGSSTQSEVPIVHLDPGHSPSDHSDQEPVKPPNSNYSLVERTRKSMSLLPSLPPQEPHARKRRVPRPSFPVNQFQTPRKSSPAEVSRSGASTPKDKLLEEDVDYASVFKSRPRVALSPISSPAVHVGSTPEEEFELDYGSSDWGTLDSPLTAARPTG